MTISQDTTMLGRGVKRKWSCLEELEGDSLHAASTTTEEEKKKIHEEEDEGIFIDSPSPSPSPSPSTPSDASHRLQQRELVLGLCLEKLQAGMELSLRRSVLLINTLRQIQHEIQSDPPSPSPSEAVEAHPLHPESCHPNQRVDFGDEMSVTCPGCSDVDVDSVSLPMSPEIQSQDANTHTNTNTNSNISPSDQHKSLPTAAAVSSNSFSDAVNAMGYLGDLALDNIFDDIDTSMYESSDLTSAWSSGSLWPCVSVSLWAENDVKMCSSGHHSSAGSIQTCRMDLNELDHIMEILVKS